MMTKEESDLLTQTDRGTPMGELMRRYWQPVALSEEIPLGGAPIPVKVMGEELVLFRDDKGKLGLLGIHCPHRGADMSYGRVEDGGKGIPPDRRREVWEPYVRLDDHRSSAVAGSGIGLAVVRQVAEAHGGTVRIEDAEDGGARFLIDIPLHAPGTARA